MNELTSYAYPKFRFMVGQHSVEEFQNIINSTIDDVYNMDPAGYYAGSHEDSEDICSVHYTKDGCKVIVEYEAKVSGDELKLVVKNVKYESDARDMFREYAWFADLDLS